MMQKNESEQNRRKMRRGDKEAILKGLKGGLCDNYYGICCAVKYNMKDNVEIIEESGGGSTIIIKNIESVKIK